MKKTFLTFVALVAISASLWAQAPQAFNYQGVARDLSGTALAAKNISVRASVLDGSATGVVVYSETHSVSTNQFGLFTLSIGAGTATSGVFANTNWGTGSKFLKIEIDPNGGSSYTLAGTTQLLSVPYAMYAGKSGDSKWTDATGGINYSGGKVGIGTTTPNAPLTIVRNAPYEDRSFLDVSNTSDDVFSLATIGVSSGTGTNRASVGLAAIANSYYSNSEISGAGTVASKKLVLHTFDGGSTGYVAFRTGVGLDPNFPQLGAERMRIDAVGNIGIGTIAPTAKLHTNGTVRFQGLTNNSALTTALVTDINGNVYTKDISTLGGSSQWTNVTGGINYSGGRVGIGTTTPVHSISVEKKAAYDDRGFLSLVNTDDSEYSQVISGYASGTGNNQAALEVNVFAKSYYPSTFPHRSGTVMFRTNKMALVGKGADGYIAFRTGVNPNDLDAATENARIDANGNFGIGTIAPTAQLHTTGSVRLQGLTSNNTATNALVADANGNVYTRNINSLSPWTITSNGLATEYISVYNTKITTNGHVLTLDAKGSTGYGALLTMRGGNTGSDDYWGFNAEKDQNIFSFQRLDANGQYPYMTVNNTGYLRIGAGAISGKAKLHISSGDVYLDDATKGIIMKNASGQCYRVTVGTAGALVSTLITCP